MPIDGNKLFETYLDYSTVKQKLISKNIANINTLFYQREDISFDDYLSEVAKDQMKVTDGKQIEFANGIAKNPEDKVITKDTNPELESNFNNIEIDKEMADLARNSIMFKFASRKVGNYYKTLQSIISREK